jgi:hypothetical protein
MLTPIVAFFREEFGLPRERVAYGLGIVTLIFGLIRGASAGVDGVTCKESGEPLSNRFRLLNMQEVTGPLDPALFHLSEPQAKARGDLGPQGLGFGAQHRQDGPGNRSSLIRAKRPGAERR